MKPSSIEWVCTHLDEVYIIIHMWVCPSADCSQCPSLQNWSKRNKTKKQNVAYSKKRTSGGRLSEVRLLSHCKETPWHHDPLSWVNVGQWNHETITLFKMWVGSMTHEYVDYIPWVPWTNCKFFFIIHIFGLSLVIWGSYIYTLHCARGYYSS